ncbi:MAG: GGDEF domain-containing protein, partial [Spirochaetes bacterium]|nr:GGDEF domain-containing protein [Spirochaetota bacterium]
VMLAIDNLKFINATFGHSSGDTALRHAVTILRNRLRSVDTIGRYGGEEFLLLLPETNHQGALEIANAIKSSLAGNLCVIRPDCRLQLDAQISIFSFEKHDIGFEAALQALSAALEQSQKNSCGTITDSTVFS